jgi:hypothetical protein
MKRLSILGAGITVVAALFFAIKTRGVDGDPYTALKLYDRNWEVKMSGQQAKIDQLENHCAQTGLFFLRASRN